MKSISKRIRAMLVAILLLLCSYMLLGLANAADTVTIDSTQFSIYGIDSSWEEYIQIPSSYPKKHQIKVTGATNATYTVTSGENLIDVSSSGLVTVHYETWYWSGGFGTTAPMEGAEVVKEMSSGKAVIKVVAGGKSFNVTVNVKDYTDAYVDKVMKDYISKNVTSTMTGYEKVEAAAKFAASYDYSVHSSSAKGMIITGGGDCWASTDAIIELCSKMGIEAWSRNGNKDPGAGSGHMNAMAKVDGKYYEAEAGYVGTAPRMYSVHERTSLFSYKYVDGGLEIYQYDGHKYPTTLTIPSKINGEKVVSIASVAFPYATFETVVLPAYLTNISDFAFSGTETLKTINIPAKVENIGTGAFAQCTSLTSLTVDENNANYYAAKNVIYSKDKKILVTAPSRTTLSVPSTVTEIAPYAFYYNSNLTTLNIPSSVKVIGEGALGDCSKLVALSFASSGLTTLGDFALANCSNLKMVDMPTTLMKVGRSAFSYSGLSNIYFTGKAPAFDEQAFAGCYGKTMYYPKSDTSWTSSVRGQYGGEVTWKAWTVILDRIQISKATAKLSTSSYVFTGHEKKPEVTLTYDGKTLTMGTDYTIEYENNIQAGTANIIITGMGKFTGEKIVKFTIEVLDLAKCQVGINKIGNMAWGQDYPGSCVALYYGTELIDPQYAYLYCYDLQDYWSEEAENWLYSSFTIEAYSYNANVKGGFSKTYKPLTSTTKINSATITSQGVTLKWNAIPGVLGYAIYRKSDGGAYEKIASIKSGTTSSYVDKKAPNGGATSTYYVRPYTKNDKGSYIYLANSKAVQAVLATPAPTVANSASGVKVSWDKNTNATGYYVYRKTGSGSWTKIATIKNNTTVSYTDKTAVSGTAYYYTVRAYNGSNISAFVKNVSIKYLKQPTVTLKNTATGVKVSWDKITGAASYTVYRKTSSDTGWTKLAAINSGATVSYTDKTAVSGTTYYYTVRAFNGTEKSSFVANVSIKYLKQPAVTLSNVTGGVKVAWTKTTGATSYIVYRKTASSGWTKLNTITGSSTLSYVDKTAKSGTVYYYTVKAVSDSYVSSFETNKSIKK